MTEWGWIWGGWMSGPVYFRADVALLWGYQMIQVLELAYWKVGFCRLRVCDCPGAPVHSLVDEAGPKARAALLVGRIGAREIWSCCLPTGRWNWVPVSLSEGC